MNKIAIQFRQIAYSLFKLIWIILSSPFSKSSRYHLGEMYQTASYPFFGTKYITLGELLNNNNLQLSIAPVKANRHNVSEFELVSICALIKDRNTSQIFEIGTFDGRTTRAMAMNINERGHIYTLNLSPDTNILQLNTNIVDIDLSKKVISGERFINTAEGKKITQLWGDSAAFNFSTYENKMDFVFIDGAHSESYLQSDTMNAMKLIKENGGIIIWHDAHLFGVKDFLKKFKYLSNVYFIRYTSLAVMEIKNGNSIDISYKP
ncbi:MAG: class I SAM-dependent methyltransferase [Ginsengibacter sp.]